MGGANRTFEDVTAVLDWVRDHPNGLLAVALSPGGYALARSPSAGDDPTALSSTEPNGLTEPDTCMVRTVDAAADLGRIESEVGPRWVWWNSATSLGLALARVGVQRCWDVVAMQALIEGGGTRSVAEVWCELRGLDVSAAPTLGQMTLVENAPAAALVGADTHDATPLSDAFEYLADGYLRPEWIAEPASLDLESAAGWAATALVAAELQRARLGTADDPVRRLQTAHSESAAELLCAELSVGGLPFDTGRAMSIIEQAAGPRPVDRAHSDRLRTERDDAVLDLAPPGRPVDLRNPADVKELLRRIELDLPDTRAGRLRPHVDHHPLVPALLSWRKAERLSNTYGYEWMDSHVHNGRLRGRWSSYDGAAGRMTASAGLHNLPSELRPAVIAEHGHRFVRADLGQIEPRVLAAVSGDGALIAATGDDDLYASIADRLKVDRGIAKLAVLGAMYGSTTGEAANALRRLEREYPVAMGYLNAAAAQGRDGATVYTIGGRPIHMWESDTDGDLDRAQRIAAARGRFARNAVIQGAAAEFFKMWAVIVRSRSAPHGAEIVLCLHDEILVHTPADVAESVATIVDAALVEVAARWSPQPGVRFVSDTSIIDCWADAK